MRTAVDTNVFSIMWLGGNLAARAREILTSCTAEGSLVISPIVYAETLANRTIAEGQAQAFLREVCVRIDWEIRQEVWYVAGQRFGRYAQRRRASGGGESRRLLADFVVGAHALLQAERLLTLDTGRYRKDFPELRLVEIK